VNREDELAEEYTRIRPRLIVVNLPSLWTPVKPQ
jgi:hypothetical protein